MNQNISILIIGLFQPSLLLTPFFLTLLTLTLIQRSELLNHWARTRDFKEDIFLLKEFFGHWMDDSDLDELRCGLLEALLDLINGQPTDIGIPKMKKALQTIVMQTPDFSEANLKAILTKRGDLEGNPVVQDLVGALASAKTDLEPGSEIQAWKPWDDIKNFKAPEELEVDQSTHEVGGNWTEEEIEARMLRKAAFAQASKAAGEAGGNEMGLSEFLDGV